MDFLSQMTAQDAPRPEEAETQLDLRGSDRHDALHRLDHMVRQCKRAGVASLYVAFDPAKPGAGETLFQPVARFFKVEKFNGHVTSVTPLIGHEAAGVFVRFTLP